MLWVLRIALKYTTARQTRSHVLQTLLQYSLPIELRVVLRPWWVYKLCTRENNPKSLWRCSATSMADDYSSSLFPTYETVLLAVAHTKFSEFCSFIRMGSTVRSPKLQTCLFLTHLATNFNHLSSVDVDSQKYCLETRHQSSKNNHSKLIYWLLFASMLPMPSSLISCNIQLCAMMRQWRCVCRFSSERAVFRSLGDLPS